MTPTEKLRAELPALISFWRSIAQAESWIDMRLETVEKETLFKWEIVAKEKGFPK